MGSDEVADGLTGRLIATLGEDGATAIVIFAYELRLAELANRRTDLGRQIDDLASNLKKLKREDGAARAKERK